MVEQKQLLALLREGLPSQRAAAAEVLRKHPSLLSRDQILQLLTQETISTIRRSLEQTLQESSTTDRPAKNEADGQDEPEQSTSNRLRDLAGLISHETEPAIGWLRRAAATEMGSGFYTSETNRSIETLRSRLEGLALLAEVSRPLSIKSVNLAGLIRGSLPEIALSGLSEARFQVHSQQQVIEIETDDRLLGLILSNALRNAAEASRALGREAGPSVVEIETNSSHFWITIRNRFNGSSFSLDEVANTGMSTKTDHKGYGVNAIRYAADRLGYTVSLTGQGGVAVFSLRGERGRG